MALQAQSVDLARERFVLYVPPTVPPQGYSLLVFVPPWRSAIVPAGWAAVLDRHGMIFVSAANSGNDANVLSRRIPLALLAAHNVLGRYPIDRDRVYIGGFSGGSRVAQRVAVAYPDVFHGALLNSGSDPIGDAQIALPSAGLFRQFQSSTRLVYITGNDDRWNVERDEDTRHSMRQWCVFGLSVETTPRAGHEPPAPPAFERALSALAEPAQPDSAKLAECGARIVDKMTAQLAQVRVLIGRGKRGEAGALLKKIDGHYGGLAAPESIELAELLDAPR
jgi:dienelactone hydrolase